MRNSLHKKSWSGIFTKQIGRSDLKLWEKNSRRHVLWRTPTDLVEAQQHMTTSRNHVLVVIFVWSFKLIVKNSSELFLDGVATWFTEFRFKWSYANNKSAEIAVLIFNQIFLRLIFGSLT